MESNSCKINYYNVTPVLGVFQDNYLCRHARSGVKMTVKKTRQKQTKQNKSPQ